MAWSAPASPWTAVSEIMVAAKMNILADDVRYLKGMAGTVAIESGVAVTGALSATGTVVAGDEVQSIVAAGGSVLAQGTNNASFARYRMLAKTSGGATIDWRFLANGGGFSEFSIYEAATERMRVAAGGNVMIGAGAPQGKLHGYNSIAGFLHWEYDGVDGTARTIIPDGAGDVQYGLIAAGYMLRDSAGTVTGTTTAGAPIAPGGAVFLYNTGGNALTLACAANGSVTVQRTAGALTYKVALWLLWL